MDILFNQQQADSLFPFHLKINSVGIIVDCGKSIQKKQLSWVCCAIGYGSEELIGRNITEFVPKDKVPIFESGCLNQVL